MTSFFGGKTDIKSANQNHKMVDGPVPEVAAHSYEGAPTVKSNGEHALFSRSYIYLSRRLDDTLGLKKAREALFGPSAKSNVNSVMKTLDPADPNDTSKALRGGPIGFGGPAGGAKLIRPSGIFVSDEAVVSGKRYADRPEGLDQFGAEEAERDPGFVSDTTTSKIVNADDLSRYADRPAGLDQFGGEESERERVELEPGEVRDVGRLKEWPEGLDQFGGEDSERVTVELKSGERRSVNAQDLKRFKDQPQGLDLFGGEETERKV